MESHGLVGAKGNFVPRWTSRGKRYLWVAIGLLVVAGVLVALKGFQIATIIAVGKEAAIAGPRPEAVAVSVAKTQEWERTVAAVGTVSALKSVTVSSDAPGRVVRIHFESGAEVKKGQVLVELDSNVERAQLASAEARRKLAKTTAERSKALYVRDALPAQELDRDRAAFDVAATDEAALRAEIDRKTVRAPFSGRLGIRNVDIGQYLNAGTTVTTLEAIGEVFVDFSIPQQQLAQVREGMPVRVTMEGNRRYQGTIAAIDPRIEETTRTTELRAVVPNERNDLRRGMFVNVSVVSPKRERVVAVPATAVVHAPYGDSVFILEPKKPGTPGMDQTPDGKPVKIARQQFVRLGRARGDFVAIVEGVKAGQEIVVAGAFKLRNGAPVVVDNTIKPEPELEPRPENR